MINAKKSLGQNFLNNPVILEKIADAAGIEPKDAVLEIGPGKGSLTEVLLGRAAKVVAVEKDDRLIAFLRDKFKKEITSGTFELIHGDALELDPSSHAVLQEGYRVAANIPYYITGAILRALLEAKVPPKSMALLTQKEVAERIVARDGKESLLSIGVKAYGTPRYVQTVKAGNFSPVPNVDSAILAIEDMSRTRFKTAERDHFFSIVRAGFAHKRKQLFGNLKSHYDENTLRDAFVTCKLPLSIRAEDVPLRVWERLADAIPQKSRE